METHHWLLDGARRVGKAIRPGFGRSTDSEPKVSILRPSIPGPSTETESVNWFLTVQLEPLSSEYSILKSYSAPALAKDSSSTDTLIWAFRVQSNFRVTLVL